MMIPNLFTFFSTVKGILVRTIFSKFSLKGAAPRNSAKQ